MRARFHKRRKATSPSQALDPVDQVEHLIRVDGALATRIQRQILEQELDQARTESRKQRALLYFGVGVLVLLSAVVGLTAIRLVVNPQAHSLLLAGVGGLIGRIVVGWALSRDQMNSR